MHEICPCKSMLRALHGCVRRNFWITYRLIISSLCDASERTSPAGQPDSTDLLGYCTRAGWMMASTADMAMAIAASRHADLARWPSRGARGLVWDNGHPAAGRGPRRRRIRISRSERAPRRRGRRFHGRRASSCVAPPRARRQWRAGRSRAGLPETAREGQRGHRRGRGRGWCRPR
jgi:hypothetical protein